MSYETNRIEEFLTTFGKAAGLPELALTDEGTLFLSLDGTALTLRHFPATDDLVLASTVAKRPEGEAERLALCEKALKMNAFSRETGEGVGKRARAFWGFSPTARPSSTACGFDSASFPTATLRRSFSKRPTASRSSERPSPRPGTFPPNPPTSPGCRDRAC